MLGTLCSRRAAALALPALLLLAALAVSLPSTGFADSHCGEGPGSAECNGHEAPALKIRTNGDGYRAMIVSWATTSLAEVKKYRVWYSAVDDTVWLEHDLTAAGALIVEDGYPDHPYADLYTVIDGLYSNTEYRIMWTPDNGTTWGSWITPVFTEATANSPARIKVIPSGFYIDENTAGPAAVLRTRRYPPFATAMIFGYTGVDADRTQNEMTYALEDIPGNLPGASNFEVIPWDRWGWRGQDAYIIAKEPLDYETASSYTLRLTLSDGRDEFGAKDLSVDDSRVITIHVNDVAEEEPVEPPGDDPTPRSGDPPPDEGTTQPGKTPRGGDTAPDEGTVSPDKDAPPGDGPPPDKDTTPPGGGTVAPDEDTPPVGDTVLPDEDTAPPGGGTVPPDEAPVDPDPIEPPPPAEKPGRVQNLQAAAGGGSLTVTWGSPASGGPAERYEVRYRSAGKGNRTWTTAYAGAGTSAEITGLAGGQKYIVRVFAVNERGTSRSATVRATPRR